jgi:hypothetical protein
MQTVIKSICELCGREFDKPVGLTIHQRTCKTKATEKEKDAQYEEELVEMEKERHGMFQLYHFTKHCDIDMPTSESDAALAARNQPRRIRAWENPKLRGKPPVKTLAAKTGEN